jgi:hypothetical protein
LDDLREHLYALARQAKANKASDRYKLGGYLVLALDANEPFASRSRCCEACCTRQGKVAGPEGQITEVTEYDHRAVLAHWVGADVVLDLEPIRAGQEECAAALRLLARLRRRLGVRFLDVVTVDVWYTKSPFLQAVRKLGWEVVAGLKQTDYEACQEAGALRPAQAQVLLAEAGRQVQLREVRDLWLTQKPLPKVRVVLSDERWEQRQRRGPAWTRQVKQSHWRTVATEGLNPAPAKVIGQMGHGRWGIENQAFNLLTQAYHPGHCFHHHPVAIVAWLWITRLAVNRTTLFFRQWVAPRAQADFTRSDWIEEWRASLAGQADWERGWDSG